MPKVKIQPMKRCRICGTEAEWSKVFRLWLCARCWRVLFELRPVVALDLEARARNEKTI